ncbi:serine-rich adhesin for platelets-like isoform X2 [Symsagittifera roscoffensis]|uniref:serine-rich adhesin for platelets-like isoform X2 n=1 Tax=Symsagittifera roscoffensis TaxID=84072 RepID=UPI00307BDB3B
MLLPPQTRSRPDSQYSAGQINGNHLNNNINNLQLRTNNINSTIVGPRLNSNRNNSNHSIYRTTSDHQPNNRYSRLSSNQARTPRSRPDNVKSFTFAVSPANNTRGLFSTTCDDVLTSTESRTSFLPSAEANGTVTRLRQRMSANSKERVNSSLSSRRSAMSYSPNGTSSRHLTSTKFSIDSLMDDVISSVQTKLNGNEPPASERQPLIINSNSFINQSNLCSHSNMNVSACGKNSSYHSVVTSNQAAAKASFNTNRTSGWNYNGNSSHNGVEDFIQAGDFLKYKVKMRDATMYQEDLLDPELVQVQTFKKARPESGWVSILINAAIRSALMPFLFTWWMSELSRAQYMMLLSAWFMATWNLKRYFMSQPPVSSSSFSVYELELICPFLYLFLLTFTYCHIHNARKRTSKSSSNINVPIATIAPKSPNTSQEAVTKALRKGHSTVHVTRRKVQNLRPVSSGGVPNASNRLNRESNSQNRQHELRRSRLSSMDLEQSQSRIASRNDNFTGVDLSPVMDLEREDVDFDSNTNNEDRRSVSSLEEHVQTQEMTNCNGDQSSPNIPHAEVFEPERPVPFARDGNLERERESFEISAFDSLSQITRNEENMRYDNNLSQITETVTQPLELESTVEDNETSVSDATSRVVIATDSTALDVETPTTVSALSPSDAREHHQLHPKFVKKDSDEVMEYLDAMVQSSVQVFHMSPEIAHPHSDANFGFPNQTNDVTKNDLRLHNLSILSDDSSLQGEVGSSVEVTSVDLDSETPPWTSRQLSNLSTNSEIKRHATDWYGNTAQITDNRSFSFQVTNQRDDSNTSTLSESCQNFVTASANLSNSGFLNKPTTICNKTYYQNDWKYGKSDAREQFTNYNVQLQVHTKESEKTSAISSSQAKATSSSSLTIGRNRSRNSNSSSSLSRLGPSLVGATPIRKRQSLFTFPSGRSSFLHKSIVKYLQELEKKAKDASLKENNAQLTWRDRILRFLMSLRVKIFGELIETQRSKLGAAAAPPGCTLVSPEESPVCGGIKNVVTGETEAIHETQSVESEEEENGHGNILEESEEEEDEDVHDGEGQEDTGGSSIEEVEDNPNTSGVNINGDNFTRLDGGLASADDISWNKANSSTANQTPEKTVKIITWNQMGRCNKANLTAEQVVEVIVNRADLIRNSNFYFAFGIFSAVFISCMPFLYRYYTVPQYTLFGDIIQLVSAHENFASSDFIVLEIYLSYFSVVSSFLTCVVFFLLLAAAERTYLQRHYYSKYLYRLTSSKKARKCEIPHFRLTKVRNIKMWLYIRFKLKAHGPQKTVEVIVSNCLLFCVLSVSCCCFQMLEHNPDNPEGGSGSGSDTARISLSGFYNPSLASWVAITWCLALGSLLLRFITIGTKVNKQYSNTAMLTTERINLSLRMENKPEKREEYFLADRVLKLACRLISEVESPFKVSGLVMNSVLYNVMRVIILSAISAVMSEILGFKLKLWKI